MPHYKDGTATKIGDVVKGAGYNLKDADGKPRVFVGTVVGITPDSAACNIQVAYIETREFDRAGAQNSYFFAQRDNVVLGCGGNGGKDGPVVGARVGLEYGQCDAFEKIG